MCTIKSIIKEPKLQQMSEGYCLCPAPAPLKMHRMDALTAHAACQSAQNKPRSRHLSHFCWSERLTASEH